MTDSRMPGPERDALSLEPVDLDGHTVQELGEYLDSGRTPIDPSIESSAGCQIALSALHHLREISPQILEAEALAEPEPEESWIRGIMRNIGREAHAGRSIPISHPSASADLAITEGAVRGLIRTAGDTVEGLVVGRCRLNGDVATPGEPITITIEAAVYWGQSIPDTADRLRAAVYRTLLLHTDLAIAGVDITIHDVHSHPAAPTSGTP